MSVTMIADTTKIYAYDSNTALEGEWQDKNSSLQTFFTSHSGRASCHGNLK